MKAFSIGVYYPDEGDDQMALLVGPNEANLSVLYAEFAEYIGSTWEDLCSLSTKKIKENLEKINEINKKLSNIIGRLEDNQAFESILCSAHNYAQAFSEWLIKNKEFKTLEVEEKMLGWRTSV